jgi:transcriptional regulator with XRE-family HTH domain
MVERTFPDASAQERAKNLGDAIRRARHPMSQVELAKRLGCPQSAISQRENAKVSLTVEHVYRIEEALGLPAGQILLDAGFVSPKILGVPGESVRSAGPWHPPEGTPARFPDRLQAWLDEFQPLIDSLCLLRNVPDDRAVASLLCAQPLVILRLGWELWLDFAVEAEVDPDGSVATVVGSRTLAKCRFALWGSDSSESTPTGTLRLIG